ncbi:hypothetical protein PHET_12165, partial [Paragonimus heterotremus]
MTAVLKTQYRSTTLNHTKSIFLTILFAPLVCFPPHRYQSYRSHLLILLICDMLLFYFIFLPQIYCTTI